MQRWLGFIIVGLLAVGCSSKDDAAGKSSETRGKSATRPRTAVDELLDQVRALGKRACGCSDAACGTATIEAMWKLYAKHGDVKTKHLQNAFLFEQRKLATCLQSKARLPKPAVGLAFRLVRADPVRIARWLERAACNCRDKSCAEHLVGLVKRRVKAGLDKAAADKRAEFDKHMRLSVPCLRASGIPDDQSTALATLVWPGAAPSK